MVPPCIREMPAFEEVHREMEDRVVFLGVNHQDLRDEALDLLAMTRVTYPSGYDPSGDTALDYGLVGMPTTVFISADGEILSVNTGELSGDGLRQSIRMLFAT
ncbi:MAG: TlpA family protein disulfide reductase [Acidimicrobiales bacterium]